MTFRRLKDKLLATQLLRMEEWTEREVEGRQKEAHALDTQNNKMQSPEKEHKSTTQEKVSSGGIREIY